MELQETVLVSEGEGEGMAVHRFAPDELVIQDAVEDVVSEYVHCDEDEDVAVETCVMALEGEEEGIAMGDIPEDGMDPEQQEDDQDGCGDYLMISCKCAAAAAAAPSGFGSSGKHEEPVYTKSLGDVCLEHRWFLSSLQEAQMLSRCGRHCHKNLVMCWSSRNCSMTWSRSWFRMECCCSLTIPKQWTSQGGLDSCLGNVLNRLGRLRRVGKRCLSGLCVIWHIAVSRS